MIKLTFMRHEAVKHKIPELHFKPEGYASTGDAEFLDELLGMLRAKGFDPNSLVFSGFDGTSVARGETIPRHLSIFGMNENGWRKAIKELESNPAEYAEGWDTPCIGLYDKSQLAEVYSADFLTDYEDTESRIELGNISIGEYLSELGPEAPIEEALVHKDYPEGSPVDALVGLVYLGK